jgi:hypothetical protein
MMADQVVDSNRPFATSRSSGRTSAFRCAPLAALKAILAAATMTDTTRSWAKLSQPSANAAGMLSSAANLIRSIATMTGRLRRNSIHGPSGTATTAPMASPAAASADTSAGPECSTRIAMKPSAPSPNPEPYALTAYAAHNHPNRRPSDRLAMPGNTPSTSPPDNHALTSQIQASRSAGNQTTAPPARHNAMLCL